MISPSIPAFLGMELGGVKVILLHGGAKRQHVVAFCSCIFTYWHIIRMHKIDIGALQLLRKELATAGDRGGSIPYEGLSAHRRKTRTASSNMPIQGVSILLQRRCT